MSVFVTGTSTDIGKTLVSGWLCLHTGWSYWKPIQTGCALGADREWIQAMVPTGTTYPERYLYAAPESPHLAAHYAHEALDTKNLTLPSPEPLIIEGAGGIMVPLNPHTLLIDWVQTLETPVIVVASSRLGTINHTLLTLEALKRRQIPVWGVIMNGDPQPDYEQAIAFYGQTHVLTRIPHLATVTPETLKAIPFPDCLKEKFHAYTQ